MACDVAGPTLKDPKAPLRCAACLRSAVWEVVQQKAHREMLFPTSSRSNELIWTRSE